MIINFEDSHLSRLLKLLETCGWREMDSGDMEAIADRADCEFTYGASKGVFMCDNWDFVVKIPLYENDDEHNYCEMEFAAYNQILRDYPLCKDLFVEVCYLGEYGEIPVYAQTKIQSIFCEYLSFCDQKDYDEVYTTRRNRRDFDIVCKKLSGSRLSKLFTLLVFKTFGMAVLQTFAQWVNDTDQTDLHAANVGLLNNLPCVFDFAGWLGD